MSFRRNLFRTSVLALSCAAAGAQAASDAPQAAYWEAKAQCWADLARAELAQGDVHGTPATAADNAKRIRDALAAGQEPAADAEQPIFARQLMPSDDPRHGRPAWQQDIATISATLARYQGSQCRTPSSACLEVAQASVWENMEETQGARWNHGRPEIDKALTLASQAAAEFESSCQQPKLLKGVDVAAVKPLEVIDMPADALFRFDKGDAASILPGGRQAVQALASRARSYGDRVASLEVVGYTDRLGDASYNLALSQQRAATIGSLLGLPTASIPVATRGAGSSESVTGAACNVVRERAALIRCLQPDRRVMVRIMPSMKTN